MKENMGKKAMLRDLRVKTLFAMNLCVKDVTCNILNAKIKPTLFMRLRNS